MKRFLAAIAIAWLPLAALAQGAPAPKPADPALLAELERDIWDPFVQAFAENSPELWVAVHSTDFIRVMGDARRVEPKDKYFAGMGGMLKSFAERGIKSGIAFRFTERIVSPAAASERGIFEFATTNAAGNTRKSYGKFHVVSRKEGGRWKILVDYDSNEGGTINEASFLAAHAASDYSRY